MTPAVNTAVVLLDDKGKAQLAAEIMNLVEPRATNIDTFFENLNVDMHNSLIDRAAEQ